MLPEHLDQSYQTFFAALGQLETSLESDDLKQLQFVLPTLKEAFSRLVEGTEQAMAENLIESEQASRIQSIQTEMNKAMRLLNTDVVFLNTAKQPDTIQQRQQQIGTRLQSLKQYGEAVLSIWNISTAES